MTNRSLIIIGSGGHASVVESIAKSLGTWDPILILDDINHLSLIEIHDSYSNRLNYLNNSVAFPAIGDNYNRKRVINELYNDGFSIPIIINPSAIIPTSTEIGCGTCIISGVVVNNDVVVGEGCILNTNSSIDHHCNIGNYTHIAPGVTIAGHCNIGECCLIGAGSTIINGITIVDDVIIGAGGVVVEDILEPGTYIGVPVKKIK